MRLQLVVLAVVLGLALADTETSYDGFKVFQLTATEEQLALLSQFDGATGYDFWSRGRTAGKPIDIMVSPQEQVNFLVFLKEHSIQNELIISNVQTVFEAEKYRQLMARSESETGRITFNKYYTHAEINAYLAEMAATYPSVASVVTIGKSTQNRNINVLKISRGGSNPIIWVDSGIHAREWIAPAMALFIINQLLENSANSDLLTGVDWHILPVLNADGYDFSHTNTRLWRKTRSTVSSTTCPGVDANRNWDFHWNEVGASSSPCSDIFAGPQGFSEPENVAVRDHLNANKNQIKLYLTFHSYGNYFLYPWGWTTALPSDWKVLDDLAREADAAQQAAGGDAYEIGTSTNVLYAAAGGSDDWAKGVAGINLSYTIELPGGGANGFDLPASQIQKTVSEFFPAIRVFGNHIKGGKN